MACSSVAHSGNHCVEKTSAFLCALFSHLCPGITTDFFFFFFAIPSFSYKLIVTQFYTNQLTYRRIVSKEAVRDQLNL